MQGSWGFTAPNGFLPPCGGNSSSLLAETVSGAGQGAVCTWGLHGSQTHTCNYMCLQTYPCMHARAHTLLQTLRSYQSLNSQPSQSRENSRPWVLSGLPVASAG